MSPSLDERLARMTTILHMIHTLAKNTGRDAGQVIRYNKASGSSHRSSLTAAAVAQIDIRRAEVETYKLFDERSRRIFSSRHK